jgi:hypothetical protein
MDEQINLDSRSYFATKTDLANLKHDILQEVERKIDGKMERFEYRLEKQLQENNSRITEKLALIDKRFEKIENYFEAIKQDRRWFYSAVISPLLLVVIQMTFKKFGLL